MKHLYRILSLLIIAAAWIFARWVPAILITIVIGVLWAIIIGDHIKHESRRR